MKKRILLAVSLLAVMALLSGCMSMISGTSLEAMFGTGESGTGTQVQPSLQPAATFADGDTVTVSRAEYEKYKKGYERLEKFSELADLYDIAEENFYWDPDEDRMIEFATKGLMAGLDDPYSFYYSSEEFQKLWEEDEGNYVGIGVMILGDGETQTCTITRVFKGSPAEEAGVQRGDILYRVEDDLYVTAENLTEAVNIMRGEPGTSVNVTFLRNEEEITFNILRKQISVNQIESTMLEDSIGYIAMYQFAGEAEKEFENALNELIAQGARSLIIDLRDNPGGWVDQARYIGDLFMDEGDLCYLVYRDGSEDHIYRTNDGKVDISLTILVNENTASSSEILTGALRDRADATVVGTTSFGKGIVQAVNYVGSKGAGYQITIAEYFSPKGNKVHKEGVVPDVLVERPEDDNGTYDFADLEHDVQLSKALEIAREKLK